jgi:thioredoxin reductase (NADPH)
VRTGANVAPDDLRSQEGPDRPLPLESNVLGVFAVGDARSGSVKRVGGAIGEGAAVVAQLHTFLGSLPTAMR